MRSVVLAQALAVSLALIACDDAAPTSSGPGSAATPVGPTTGAAASSSGAPAASASGQRSDAPESVPTNVILVTIDSLRADRMPWHGYRHAVMPTVAAFAAEAVNFTRFYALSSYTSMTFGGFVAGRYPSEVKRSGYFFSSTPEEVVTFPEVLSAHGVHTAAAHGHWYFGKEGVGLDQGFSRWELVPGLKKSNTTDNNITSPEHVALAIRQLSEPALTDKPFFAWYHLMDPHDMYMGHEGTPSFGRGAGAMYDGELHFTDRHLKTLLEFVDAQPWADRTAVMISSDHGETFGEHEMYRHGFELWQELVWVPLLVRIPGVAPKRVDVPRSGIDLPPTLFELLAVERPRDMQGVSLVAEMRGDVEPELRAVIIDLPRTSDNDRRRALVWDRHKLIAHADDEYFKLFDLEADPREQRDLAASEPKLLEQMLERYRAASQTIREVCPSHTKLKGKKKDKPC